MESAISIFRKLPETKEQVGNYVRLIKESVLNGEVEPLQFAANVSALEQLFKALKSDVLIKDVILEEAEKYGAKSFEHGNAKFQIKEVGVKYDFTECNDSELFDIDNELRVLTAKKKARETLLKAISPEDEVYGSDGVQLAPPLKTSTTQVTITLK
jgi:hypothetical protein